MLDDDRPRDRDDRPREPDDGPRDPDDGPRDPDGGLRTIPGAAAAEDTIGGPAPRCHRLHVRRTARYCTLGGEGDDGRADVCSVWYVLHGYRQLAGRFIERFRELATPTRLIVAPEALNRFYLDDDRSLKAHGRDSPVGATWMTRHERDAEIADYVAYLDALDRSLKLPRGVRRIVLGFSQGSATAARWAMLGRPRVSRLVLWGGLMPVDPPAAEHARRLRRLEPVLVHGEEDPSLSAARVENEVARLAALGIPATTLKYAGGHVVDREALRELAALVG